MNKKIMLVGLASFVLIFTFLSLASAITFTDSVNSITLDQNNLVKTFTLTSSDSANFSITTPSPITLTDSDSHAITLTFTNNGSIDEVKEVTYEVTASGDVSTFNFPESSYTNVNFYIENSTNSEENVTKIMKFGFKNTNYCEDVQNYGKIDLEIEDVRVLKGFGDNDDYWYLFDEIYFEIDISNNGDWDMKDVELKWALYTTNGIKIKENTLSDFKLREGDDKTLTFTFSLDRRINKFESEDAVLYVKAKGKISDNDSPYDGDYTCDSKSLEVEVRADENFVIMNNFKINGDELNFWDLEDNVLTCGQEVTVNAEIWNIGDRDQDDVYIRVYNGYMKINEVVNIGDIDKFKHEDFAFTFNIPEDLEEKWYSLRFEIYDDDDDIFENSEDDLAKFENRFKVEGCNVVIPPTITAKLESEAIEGKELVVKATITNNNNKETIYNLELSGFGEWADLKAISGDVLRLQAGESVDVFFTFDTKKGSAGEKIFYLEVISDNEVVANQPIGVSIKKSGTNLTDFFRKNWKLAGIIILNLILVIAIIIVAVRIYRR